MLKFTLFDLKFVSYYSELQLLMHWGTLTEIVNLIIKKNTQKKNLQIL